VPCFDDHSDSDWPLISDRLLEIMQEEYFCAAVDCRRLRSDIKIDRQRCRRMVDDTALRSVAGRAEDSGSSLVDPSSGSCRDVEHLRTTTMFDVFGKDNVYLQAKCIFASQTIIGNVMAAEA